MQEQETPPEKGPLLDTELLLWSLYPHPLPPRSSTGGQQWTPLLLPPSLLLALAGPGQQWRGPAAPPEISSHWPPLPPPRTGSTHRTMLCASWRMGMTTMGPPLSRLLLLLPPVLAADPLGPRRP